MNKAQAQKLLKIKDLRFFQHCLISALVHNVDVMCFMPTSAGKSIIFQITALRIEELVLVIEPHLALELDQVRQLQELGISAACLNSLTSSSESKIIFKTIENRTLRLLYLTPEMLQNTKLQQVLMKANVKGVMVDEAHCIVKQGPGFRDKYLQIGKFVNSLPSRPVVGAFTATATEATANAIEKHLCLRDPFIYRRSVTRDNIQLSVVEVGNGLGGKKDADVIELRKRELICTYLKKLREGRVIIYTNTISRTEKLCKYLKKKKFNVSYYHGKCNDKAQRLRNFLNGEIQIMVATNAFGLGVNIPDIRLVIHHAPLMGLDDYVQEAGRAGRDGSPSKALLLWHQYDFTINRRLIKEAELALTGQELKERLEALDALKLYAESEDECRWRIIRKFFGEEKGKRCNHNCDICKRQHI